MDVQNKMVCDPLRGGLEHCSMFCYTSVGVAGIMVAEVAIFFFFLESCREGQKRRAGKPSRLFVQ